MRHVPLVAWGGSINRRSPEGSERVLGWRTRLPLGSPGRAGASLISGHRAPREVPRATQLEECEGAPSLPTPRVSGEVAGRVSLWAPTRIGIAVELRLGRET